MSGSGGSRATVSVPVDAVIRDPDPSNNNDTPGTAASPSSDNLASDRQIGVPDKDFNIHLSVLYTHNYFEKVKHEPGGDVRAKCLPCSLEKKKTTLLRISDNNIRGTF